MKILFRVGLMFLATLSVFHNANAALSLSVGDAYYLGQIVNGAPAAEENEVSYINYLTTLAAGDGPVQLPPPPPGGGEFYDRIDSSVAGPFPTAIYPPGTRQDSGTPNTINAGLARYVLGKYGGYSLVWYFKNGAGEVTLPAQGLSHISMYNPVPEPSTYFAAALLLIPLLAQARRLRRSA